MSEMFRPAPPPAASDHDQHDKLLVAQVVAGDRLDPARADVARGWLATCPACATLAAELRVVSTAVASEPVPPRRRDFRLDPEQAKRLTGNAFTRFLRGLLGPRARVFAPAAAGVMSLGLAFVVVGYVWPDDGTVPVGTDAEAPPAAVEERLSGSPLPAVQALPTAEMTLEQAAPAEPGAGLEYFASEPEALEGLAEHQAGTSARSESMEKSLASELSDEVSAVAAPAADGVFDDEAESDRGAVGETLAEASDLANGGDLDTTAVEQLDDVVSAGEPDVSASGAGSVSDEDGGLEHWLVFVGVALAVAGGLLLLLAWLSRRTADPLLR